MPLPSKTGAETKNGLLIFILWIPENIGLKSTEIVTPVKLLVPLWKEKSCVKDVTTTILSNLCIEYNDWFNVIVKALKKDSAFLMSCGDPISFLISKGITGEFSNT